jgi:hypothetical protein
MRGRAWLVVAACALASGVARAQPAVVEADASPLDLEWNAPAECPARAAVLAEVTRTLGSAQVVNRRVNVRVDIARVGRDEANGVPGKYRGTVRIGADGGAHPRQLEADECVAVTSAAALILALAVEGMLPPPAPPTPATEAPPPPPPAPRAELAPGPPWRSRLVVSAAALVDTATLPSVAVGPEVGAGWRGEHGALRLGLGLRGAFFPSLFGGVADPTTAGEGGRFGLLEGAARGCAAYAWRALEVGPCVGVGVDHMSASGRGSQVTLSGSGTWASGQGAAVAAFSLTRALAISGSAGFVVPFARPTFVVDSASSTAEFPAHRPAPVSARLGLGLELRFF